MSHSIKLTIEEILKEPIFRKAEVVAGKKGLKSIVKWIHIIEVTNISHLLNGNELVLTTGVGWKYEEKTSMSLLRQLIDKNVAGICVELGTYIEELPKELIELANLHNFPVIVFYEEVRFLDITQEINSLFVESHNQIMIKMEAISNQFNNLLVAKNGFQKILRLIHQTLNAQIIYYPNEAEAIYYPNVTNDKKERYLEEIKEISSQSMTEEKSTSAKKAVEAIGIKFADLVIISNNKLIEFDYLVLDRAATALSQDRLRQLYVEQQEKNKQKQWVYEWINGEHNQLSITQHLQELESDLSINGCVGCIYELHPLKDIDLTYDSFILESVFKENGFYSLISVEQKHLLIILINQLDKTDWKKRLDKAINHIKDIQTLKAEKSYFSVGTLRDLPELSLSIEQAKETLYIVKKKIVSTYYYDELFIYRIILKLKKENYLNQFVLDHLSSIIKYDKKHKGELYQTLKILLQTNGSRKEAAEQLFIVRQTLYHRIEKLKELLGDDFMEKERKTALELSIYAMDLIDE